MNADASRKPASQPVPPPLVAIRGRSGRVADLAVTGGAFSGPPDTPPRQSLVSVPYVWEDAPGKPKGASPTASNVAEPTPAAVAIAGHVPEVETGDRQDSGGHADLARPNRPLKLPPRLLQRVTSLAAADTRQGGSGGGPAHADQAAGPPPRPLKLPPRLQQVPVPAPPPPSFAAAAEYTPSPSPKTVLHGPYHGCKPPKWVRSGGAALKRTPSAGMALLSRTLSKRRASGAAVAPASGGGGRSRGGAGGAGDHERDAAGHDAPWGSPASSSSSSSVSASTRFAGDGHYAAGRGRHGDAREAASDEEDDGGGSPTTRVRFTRFARTRSLPSLTTSTSNLWAYVRKGVKQVTPILHGARSWATARYGH